MRYFVSFLLVALVSGCQYQRSFLNMNSDSGAPFLGMQLSVDARDINKEPVTGQEAIRLVSADTTVSVSTLKTDTARAQSPERVPADSEKSRFMPGVFPTPLATIEASENPLTAAGRQLASF
ncbi:MAG: hypothetical protein MK102_15900 [Fuerstiella sp.]|nr:hypothetical protein [Fuerstiella sp.]